MYNLTFGAVHLVVQFGPKTFVPPGIVMYYATYRLVAVHLRLFCRHSIRMQASVDTPLLHVTEYTPLIPTL